MSAYVIYGSQPHVGASTDALTAFYGGDRLQRSARRAVSPAHRGRRSPGVLDRRLRKSHAHIGTQRLRVGRRRVDFVPARDADHGRDVRALAGRADLERALRGGGRSRRARLAGRHHVAEQWILGTGRRLFTVRLAHHRGRVGPGREPDPLDPKSYYACGLVMPQKENTMTQPDDGSRRRFLKTSMFGLAVAFSPSALTEAFADSKSKTIQE